MFFFFLFLAGIVLFYVILYFPFTAGLVSILSAARLIFRGRVLLVIPFILGGSYAWFRYSPPLDAFAAREILIECAAKNSPHELPSKMFMNEVIVQSAFNADKGNPLAFLNNREMSIVSDNGLKRGLRYGLTVRPAGNRERRNPGTLRNDVLYAYLLEINSSEPFKENPLITWFKDRRDMLTHYLKGNFQDDSAALLASITTGERSTMSEELRDAFIGKRTHRSLERGDAAKADGLDIQVLHPYKAFYTFADNEAATENNNSLVVKITGRHKSFLFAADVAEEAEEDLVHLGKWLKSDVLKVSHHGSRTSSSEDFLRIAAPEIGVISVGGDNSYGHPNSETLERLQGIKVYRTDRDGAVKVTETPEGLSVKTYRDFTLERTRSVGGELRNFRRLFAGW